MRSFRFRLARILELRQGEEQDALVALATATRRVEEAEAGLELARRRLEQEAAKACGSLVERLEKEGWVARLEDELAACRVVRGVVQGELEAARSAWLECRTRRRALEALRERDEAAYRKEAARKEQKASDEHASLRRAG